MCSALGTNVRHAISQGGINTPFSGRHIVTLWPAGALKNTKMAEKKAPKRNIWFSFHNSPL